MSPRPLLDPSPSPSPPPSRAPPPSPALHPVASHDVSSIEVQMARLQAPSDNDEWVGCIVQPQDFEHSNTSWATIRHLPQFHVVGKAKEGYVVAVAGFVLPVLDDLEIPYSPDEFSSGWRSHKGVSLDRRWFVQNAIAGIWRARGLVGFYREMFQCWSVVPSSLRVPIEWAIILRDIKDAPPDILETFFHSCSLLDSLLHEATHPRETPMDFIERLHRANTESAMAASPIEERAKQMHQISLLRGLLEHAGGKHDLHQHRIDKSRSANDNLRCLCELYCGNRPADPPSSSQSPRAVDECSLDRITLFVPFCFESVVYTVLPADLINNLPYSTVETTLFFGPHLPRCEPDQALSLFLCRYISVGKNYGGLAVWMASPEGRSKRGQFVQLLHDARTRPQTWVYLGALVCFERVLGSSDATAIGGGYFGQLGRNRSKTLWHYVANCLHQISRCDLDAVSWLVNEDWRPFQLADHTLVLYWHLRGFVAHDKACKTISFVFSDDEADEADVWPKSDMY